MILSHCNDFSQSASLLKVVKGLPVPLQLVSEGDITFLQEKRASVSSLDIIRKARRALEVEERQRDSLACMILMGRGQI